MCFYYGFSAVGLQDFIFRTNALREIIGASEIIKWIDNLGKVVRSESSTTVPYNDKNFSRVFARMWHKY